MRRMRKKRRRRIRRRKEEEEEEGKGRGGGGGGEGREGGGKGGRGVWEEEKKEYSKAGRGIRKRRIKAELKKRIERKRSNQGQRGEGKRNIL